MTAPVPDPFTTIRAHQQRDLDAFRERLAQPPPLSRAMPTGPELLDQARARHERILAWGRQLGVDPNEAPQGEPPATGSPASEAALRSDMQADQTAMPPSAQEQP